MARRDDYEYDEHSIVVTKNKQYAAGVPAVLVSLQRGMSQMGATRTAATLAKLNQRKGFDCPGCAWPETPGHRKHAEFCENGAKAVAEEATKRTVGPAFFAAHSIDDLLGRTEYWLGQQGRLTHPMVLRPGASHYEPIEWDDANRIIADELNALGSPHEAIFYTSGRTSNEAAFLYQLLIRSFGTNNMPDCSNMCHESSGSALTASIGIGKGSVSVPDIENADLILIAGQNPGTNHPRMLSTLEKARSNGARVIAINPLPEAGLLRFKDPQKVHGVIGDGAAISDDFLQIRIGGDMALFQGLAKLLVTAEDAAPGTVLDRRFIDRHTAGFDAWLDHIRRVDLGTVVDATGLTIEQLHDTAQALIESNATIICWAMGLTQQTHGVATIEEAVNLLLMRGMIGKPGAGVCPVRGHSNVQGDRTMGIWEKMPDSFLAALDTEFGITSPREHGLDAVDSIRAMRERRASVFMAMGGNFVSATPDTDVTEAALRNCSLTVQVSTKLNRSHLVHGRTALILPSLGRTDKDVQATGKQFVTVEDSMSMVHRSRGSLTPSSIHMRSEVAIVCGIAETLFGPGHPVPWTSFTADYDLIRDVISRVVPGFDGFNTKVRQKEGFGLPHPPRDSRTFQTETGKANFAVNDLVWLPVPPGRLMLQTMRSHDQYNTTIYGLDDRYRGVKGGRRVLFVNARDIEKLGYRDGDHVDLISEWKNRSGNIEERRADNFRLVAYPTPVGNAAAYYPETNPLIPLDHVADKSNTPVSKAILIRLEHRP
ncbi:MULTISPECIES: FdhF/YdeP family oxidoreductase [Rhodococcus]|uniref:FdhF/YdeP family oxidoreductase n=2 Tax=Rhodococcus TaxID=1827 RepID=A0AAE4V1G0_9NOCA|nr:MULTISPECIES: FdhF/YdeP family oxidoreductase [Rhodococcus]MDV7242228.1 FdhF/YdeP family oxidoreductase [Rhodococcus oxybenzonivorans]MDV7266612.1 FdhF/YdeP family oxidoreductase [Rhodococcus oxybenzonivorans]MDV7276277.1 FdhF/YdeP family oxidoreductase [Rhodococcus oxybenzonivorans]MDV7331716.1 FdhF/YdeP family oxidoreductase [Rhodococcus oxybenzonivorans]MDV7343938.1 FdhF/YdeP family oxidoreductase [Rhodococcus oxybenzonivorans]